MRIGPFEEIPFGWAISHRDFIRNTKIAYPIGIHFIVRWSRNIFFWLMGVGYPSYRQQIEHKVYLAGMKAGVDWAKNGMAEGRHYKIKGEEDE